MSSSHLLSNHTRGVYYPLSSRASSATLMLSQRIPNSHIDGATDPVDMSIAQGLLQTESPRIPRRRSSFSHSTNTQQLRFPADNDEQRADAGLLHHRRSRQGISSNTWTSSSGEGSEDDGNDDRTPFVDEYNRLAKKYSVQAIVPDEYIAVHVDKVIISAKPGSWIMRKLFRRPLSVHVSRHKTENHVRQKRSVSDISLRMKSRKDSLKGKDLIELVRLCGSSPLYLPAEYAAGTLAIPTCFRATAQYLVQHAATSRGIFRIPGAHSTINALYDHYASQAEDGEVISGTVRCPTLPEHIQCNVHDVASAFKKFLAGLPGGILGKAWLFDALTSIYSQLDAGAELMRTKQSKVRARLIALAIATVAQRYQRELICAVFGLLSMIGRAAETAPREDEHGRPLPTSDLMGYGALGIVFGPLLVGNLLDSHDLCPIGPQGSLVFVQRSPAKPSKGKHNKNKSADEPITLLQGTDKIRIVNSITEMLITHWRDVVRHMKNLGALSSIKQHHFPTREDTVGLAQSLPPELFAIRRPRDWDMKKISIRYLDRSRSPTPSSRNGKGHLPLDLHGRSRSPQDGMLSVRKQRPRPMSSQILSGARSMSILAPTIEEIPVDERREQPVPESDHEVPRNTAHLHERRGVDEIQSTEIIDTARSEQVCKLDQELSISENTGARSHLIKQDLIAIELYTKNSREAPEEGQTESNTARQVLEERRSSGENTKIDAIGRHKPGAKQIRASPFLDRREQSEELSNQRKAFSQVPPGIVSSRLRGIAASDPALDPPSVFAGIPKTGHKSAFTPERRLNTTASTFDHFPKDPLSRVSREEDTASLASLAEVIQSQDETVHDIVSSMDLTKRPDAPIDVTKSRTRSTALGTSVAELHSVDSWSRTVNREEVLEALTLATKTAPPTNTGALPLTPRRSATESSVLQRSGGSSVKALAARFGIAETNARQTPSPVHTPGTRVWHGSLVEKADVAPYTVNTSPVPMVQKLARSDTSIQIIQNPVQPKIRTVVSLGRLQNAASPFLPKPLFSNSYVQEYAGPPRWPKPRPVNGSPRLDSDAIQVGRKSVTLSPFSSTLHRTGDGNVSFALSRKSSLGPILPRPDEPPIAGHMDFARPAAVYTDHCLFPLDFSTYSPSVNNSLPGSSIRVQGAKNQSTSILYTQIQLLSRQLKAKADEADHLRQQLITKDSLHDLGTLSQQLRQVKRELAVWRSRAEVAEKMLEIFSQLPQKGVEVTVADEQSAKDLAKNSGKGFEEGGRFQTRIRKELHGFDGIWMDHGIAGSEGTIRRASPKKLYASESELDTA